MSNKKIISVVGYANISYFSTFMQEKLHNLAYELGKAIIDSNYILASGGLRGIMESCSQGARDSKKYTQGSIIGLLPNYDKSIANQYVDIALPLGFDIGRNISVASVCDAMIIVGGGAGSLSEAALAWQLKKPIIAITLDSKNIQSASDMLANKRLDNRRSDKIYEAKNVKEAIKILKQNLQSYKDKTFKCIESKIGENEAKEKLQNLFNTNLKILGSGSEGYVFSDNKNVYKIFSNPSLKLYLNLLSLSNNLESNEFFPHFNVLFKEGDLVIYYPYFKSINLLNLKYKLPKQSFIDMLNMMYFAGVIHTDLQPKNILVKKKR